ncbi:DUF4349 domain-containing protein [Methanocella sp. MCL-LM]|uniref:DUF4349 domain-containing protein n=1 Tax=Methanocella sp. MCL-LM TaxID=3412035 RepID=UPI003C741D05
MRSKRLLPLIAIAIILVVALASGCTSMNGGTGISGDRSGEYQTAPQVAPAYSDSYNGKAADSTSSYNYGAPVPTATSSTSSDLGNRKVIMTASIQIETNKFNESVDKVRFLATSAGGYVQSSSMNMYDQNRRTSTITIKVPQTAYEQTLSEIRKLGTVKSDSSSGSDVTLQYVDLESRLKNLKAEESRLIAIMDRANNVTEILAVERELSRVQGEIESYQARLNVLNSQIDFATITVYITEPQPVVSYDWGIGDAITEAVHAFVGMIAGLIVLTGYLIPLVLYLALGLAVIYLLIRGALWLYRRSQRRKAAAAPKEKEEREEKK